MSFKTNRGGMWIPDGRICRSAYRGDDHPGYRSSNYGFRLVAQVDHNFKLLRGGSWYNGGRRCRTTARGAVQPGISFSLLGFRLVAKEKKIEV